MTDDNRLWRVFLATLVVLLPALLIWRGLYGPFMLDDTPNLQIIDQLPADPSWADLWRVANSGMAGVLGRPLSLISFLLQYRSWPDPFQFKLVNLLLHLLNGILLAGVCVLLRQQTRWQLSVFSIALIVFIWLVHPIQLTAVLYVVQRMAELAAFFTLLGINFYLFGRRAILRGANTLGIGLMLFAVVVCGPLAIFSKETGALLLPFIAVLEFCLLASTNDPPMLVKSRRYMVYLLTAIGVVAFAAYLPTVMQGYSLKPFTVSERVLTQFPILFSYLVSIALLFPDSLGLYHDDFPIVTGALDPWYAIPAILALISLLLLALLKRRDWPLFAFAVLWFFTGHALESTVLPLEMYFEHRNYLPLFGPVFAIVVGLQQFIQMQEPRRQVVLKALAGLALIWMCFITGQQSRLWGNPLAFAEAAVAAHPNSMRAQSNLVESLSRAGQFQAAFEIHLRTIDPAQNRIAPYVRWLEFRCLLPAIALPEQALLARQARNSGHDFGTIFQLNSLVFGVIQNRCQPAPREELEIVLANLLQNPAFNVSAPDLLQMQAFLAAGTGDFVAAAELAAESFASRADVRVALYRSAWLIQAGNSVQARRELPDIESTFSDVINADADLAARLNYLHEQLDRGN